jgi:hypothetical protein
VPEASFTGLKSHRRQKINLVGMTKKDLYFCAGVPSRQEKVDNLEFLTYESGGDSTGVGIGTTTSYSTAIGVVSSHKRYCVVTFVLSEGTIQKINYQGRTGGWATEGEQCAFVVEPCLR